MGKSSPESDRIEFSEKEAPHAKHSIASSLVRQKNSGNERKDKSLLGIKKKRRKKKEDTHFQGQTAFAFRREGRGKQCLQCHVQGSSSQLERKEKLSGQEESLLVMHSGGEQACTTLKQRKRYSVLTVRVTRAHKGEEGVGSVRRFYKAG